MKKIQSTCNYCALACNMDFFVEDDKIVKVLPTKGYPVNDGFSCIKGLSLDKQQTVVKTSPLPKVRQKDGSFKYMEWDDTYKLVADKFLELQDKYGKESVAGISTGQLTLEEFALLGHVMRNHLKTNLDGNTRLCMASAVVAHKQSYGFDAPPYTLQDIELSDTVVLIGANPVVAHPILWGRIKANKNKKLIVIDPRRSETAEHADHWYGIKGKTDLILFYAVANLLIEKNYVDADYIAKHTEGYEDFKEFVKEYTVDQAVRSAQGIINLALMTGNIGRPGTGANSITGQCNAMGSRAFSNTAGLYGGGDFDNPVRRQRVVEVLGVDESVLAVKPTAPYNVIVEKIISGEIKGLWVVCTNPRHSWTNNTTFKEAMDKLEFLVVQDIYDDTDTSQGADVFLPVVPGIKKEGTYINTERRVSAMRPALKRKENEKTDYEVLLGLGKALGMGDLLERWKTPRDAFNLMKECSRYMPCEITGIDYDKLENSKGIQWPFKEGDKLTDDQRRLFENGKYYTKNNKAHFIFEEVMENPIPNTPEFPYTLNTGRGTVGQWHTLTRSREVKWVTDVTSDKAYAFFNTQLLKDLYIEENEVVTIDSINGNSADFIVRSTDNVKYDEIFAPMHYIECNTLTPSVYDKYSKEPSFKTTPVNIRKVKEVKL